MKSSILAHNMYLKCSKKNFNEYEKGGFNFNDISKVFLSNFLHSPVIHHELVDLWYQIKMREKCISYL